MVREETDNGRTIVIFLVQAMQGDLEDFKPCHRMSASRELMYRCFEYIPPDDDFDDEPAPDPFADERRRRYEEAVEFSLHGPLYYEFRQFPCPCEDRLHDCDGNDLTEQECEEVATLPPGKAASITNLDELETYIARYNAYITRINPGRDLDLHLDSIRWPANTHNPLLRPLAQGLNRQPKCPLTPRKKARACPEPVEGVRGQPHSQPNTHNPSGDARPRPPRKWTRRLEATIRAPLAAR